MLEPLSTSSHDMIRSMLISQDFWTPFDFLTTPVTFQKIEKQQVIDSWLRPLNREHDFRYISKQNNSTILAEVMVWDSIFFNYKIVRLHTIIAETVQDSVNCLKEWLTIAKQAGITYVLAIALPESLQFLQSLGQCGFELIETRVTYHENIEKVVLPDRFPVRIANENDIPLLQKVAQQCVNPFDRFHADPYIMPKDADRIMATWIEASIQTNFADFVLVPDVADPKAFCTIKMHRDSWDKWGINLAQSVVLGAVDKSFKGWYSKLISESNYRLQAEGTQHVFWKTQLSNRAATRTAENLGYRLGRGEHVFRLIL